MGFWWDLLQQYQIGNRRKETSSLEEQVANLDERVMALEDAINQLINELDSNDLGATSGNLPPNNT